MAEFEEPEEPLIFSLEVLARAIELLEDIICKEID
jgi:hypothetical protein